MIVVRNVSSEGEVTFTSPSGDYALTNLHPETTDCWDHGCLVHAPTLGPLSDAPYNWRTDRNIMERICFHGIGHPDHDGANFQRRIGRDYENSHGCDGCCFG